MSFSIVCWQAQAGIAFGQIANGDVDEPKKELQKIIAKKVTRSSVNVANEKNLRRCLRIVTK